jgi:predicted lipid-binding transport protein (Tim44 family)
MKIYLAYLILTIIPIFVVFPLLGGLLTGDIVGSYLENLFVGFIFSFILTMLVIIVYLMFWALTTVAIIL